MYIYISVYISTKQNTHLFRTWMYCPAALTLANQDPALSSRAFHGLRLLYAVEAVKEESGTAASRKSPHTVSGSKD
jgi:hypothetical protein